MTSSEAFRPSPQQRRAWLLRPEGTTPLARGEARLDGEVDADRLGEAVARVVARHEILRTRFVRRPGFRVPFQVIDPRAAFSWVADGSRSGAPAVDPERGPGLAVELSRLEDGGHALVLTLPSLCADAVSLELLLAEIAESYGAGEAPEPEVQYADYSEWQNELLETDDESARAARACWSERDLSAASSVSLPFEMPRGGSAERKVLSTVLLPPELVTRSRAAAESLGVTTADFWRACWLAWLGRRTGSATPGAAVRFDGRGPEELRRALGLFARWLPVAVSWDERLRFRDLLTQAVKEIREAGELQQYSSWEGTAAFGFEFDERPEPKTAGGVTFTLLRRAVATETCRLLLSCTLAEGALSARVSYDPARFEERDVERLVGELRALCRDAATRPDEPVGRLDLLEEDERRLLLVEFNDTALDLGSPRPVHDLIEAAAASAPDRVAVVCEDRSITYRELEARANRLARHLRGLGVGPEIPVTLCLDRSVEAIVALLAVWKAGGASVLLDPRQPPRRLAQALEDVRAPVALTSGGFDVPGPGRVVRLDAGAEEIAGYGDSRVEGGATPESLAYVIFTSGSTGRSKGVAVEHRQLFNYLESALRRLDLPRGGSFASVSTLSADLGHTSIFPALCTGGTLHLVSLETTADAQAFRDYVARHCIDVLKIVPSHLRALQEAPEPERVLPRRRLVLGGEASPREWALELAATDPDCLVFNHYGPSETTVGVLTFPVLPGGIDPRATTVPLGRPIPNARVYLLDRDLAAVPAWSAGELYIGGAGVARGYLGRPERTAERFVPDFLSGIPGARLYRTGDLARHLADGSIEFLGRIDHQVKFHGFRVELNEIRGRLNEHPQVRDSVVSKLQDRHGRDVLVAYYLSRQPLEVSELRAWLGESIPEETLPHVFVHLRRLPLGLNGKVNPEALPSLEEVRETLEKRYVAPRNPAEETLAAIWSEVLGVARIGIQDNFFELGGHSLLATRVISRVRQALAVEMPLRSLFETPTIAGLSAALAEGRFPPLHGSAGPGPRAAAVARGLDEQLAELERLSDQDVQELLRGT